MEGFRVRTAVVCHRLTVCDVPAASEKVRLHLELQLSAWESTKVGATCLHLPAASCDMWNGSMAGQARTAHPPQLAAFGVRTCHVLMTWIISHAEVRPSVPSPFILIACLQDRRQPSQSRRRYSPSDTPAHLILTEGCYQGECDEARHPRSALVHDRSRSEHQPKVLSRCFFTCETRTSNGELFPLNNSMPLH